MYKKVIAFILALSVAVTAVGCSLGTKGNKDKYTATVEAESFYIPAETSGRVVDLSVKQGDSIKVGDKIALLDAKVYELQKNQAEAGLQIAKLKQKDLPSSAKANVEDQAKAAVKQAQAAVDLTQLQIDKSSVVSLNAGVITDVFISKGEMASTGMNIVKVINLQDKYIRVYIEEEKRSIISLNDVIPVYFNNLKLDEGKVIYIAEESEFTPKNIEKKDDREKTVFQVKLKLSEKSDLKPGMLVEVEVK
jgi:HlyD family secretion protein